MLISLPYCVTPLDANNCNVCLNGYSPINGMCKATNCQNYQANLMDCSSCLAGFYLSSQGNICKRNP